MKKILLTTIAALLAMALNAQVSVWDGTAEPWTHGSGTPDDPYLIESAQQLAYLAEKTNEPIGDRVTYVDTCFILTVDLDLGADNGMNWNPIGVSGYYRRGKFGGHFDGGYHRITNISMTLYEGCYGLFGRMIGGSLKNIVFDGDEIIMPHIYSYTSGFSGLLLGYGFNVSIENCTNKADVVWEYINMDICGCVLGGLFGLLENSTIINCHNYGNITAPCILTMHRGAFCGGIAGWLSGCEVADCSNYGNISITNGQQYYDGAFAVAGGISGIMTGSIANCSNNGNLFVDIDIEDHPDIHVKSVGGVIGYTLSKIIMPEVTLTQPLVIRNCYSVCNMTMTEVDTMSCGGGIIGRIGDTIHVNIDNCYYVGEMSTVNMGGIVGTANINTAITNCYYLNTISSDNDFGTPKSEDEMKSEDFVSLLNTDEEMFFMDTYGYLNDGYPILKWQHESHVGVDETDWNGNVEVYPNPTDGILTINGDNLQTIEVVNILGQTVLKTSCETDKVTVDMGNHPSGIYLLKLTDAKGGKQTVKVLKE